MTDEAKKIKEILQKITITSDDFNKLIKDRLDFGFDSIYFRYAEVCDELAMYKIMYNTDNKDPIQIRKSMDGRKMHFYNTLEQLLQAHNKEIK